MAKKIVKPRLFQDAGEWWLEYEGHATNEVNISPNNLWVSGVFRLPESVFLIVMNMERSLVLRFLIAVPLASGVSNAGVAAISEYAAGGARRLCFFFPDGAMGVTEPIPELMQAERIFFDKKFNEVNLLAPDGRILNTISFGDMEATVIPRSIIYKRDYMPYIQVALGTLILLAIIAYWIMHVKLKMM